MNRLASVVVATVATVLAGTAVVTAAAGGGVFSGDDDDHDDDRGSQAADQQVVLVDGQALLGTPVAGSQPGAASPGSITADAAGQIAASSYGGTVVRVDAGYYQNRSIWQVELRGSGDGDIKVVIDSGSGEILMAEQVDARANYASYDDDDDDEHDDDDDHRGRDHEEDDDHGEHDDDDD